MTIENFTPEINWLIKNSETIQEWDDSKDLRFDGRVPSGMYQKIVKFFMKNATNSCSVYCRYGIKVGMGSINVTISKWKGSTQLHFAACLAK
ncbi:unnamed protein product [marine sediment metagenome]|uniref:Uncharacterized protein n=1 Tax=marine sediment metagenome TaxID=412755 RepID=X0VEQ1_9ZZZZ